MPLQEAGRQASGHFGQGSWSSALGIIVLIVLSILLHRMRVRQVVATMQSRMEARANERVRIAVELHDTLLQSIHGLMLNFHGATESLPQEEPARKELTEALARADIVLTEARNQVQNLRRAHLQEESQQQ